MSSSAKNSQIDAKREQFRKYLEKEGVLEYLTKSLVSLYEEPDKPSNALDYLKNNFSGKETEVMQLKIENLEKDNAQLREKVEKLEAEKAALKSQLEKLETVAAPASDVVVSPAATEKPSTPSAAISTNVSPPQEERMKEDCTGSSKDELKEEPEPMETDSAPSSKQDEEAKPMEEKKPADNGSTAAAVTSSEATEKPKEPTSAETSETAEKSSSVMAEGATPAVAASQDADTPTG